MKKLIYMQTEEIREYDDAKALFDAFVSIFPSLDHINAFDVWMYLKTRNQGFMHMISEGLEKRHSEPYEGSVETFEVGDGGWFVSITPWLDRGDVENEHHLTFTCSADRKISASVTSFKRPSRIKGVFDWIEHHPDLVKNQRWTC